MSDERFEGRNASRGMSDTDKGYYEDLYTDLPKEVVDILMQTHPLMGKNDSDAEATAYRSRRPQRREDVVPRVFFYWTHLQKNSRWHIFKNKIKCTPEIGHYKNGVPGFGHTYFMIPHC